MLSPESRSTSFVVVLIPAYHECACQHVSRLRKLGFQVADKPAAPVLVGLHHRQAFEAGLAMVGALASAHWPHQRVVR